MDWWPWGEPAFAEARRSARPIFLSIGYATCHWCHVMEHESFEDAATAEILNRDFVPVKVDREERPDVDRVYMTFVQATTGSGGWPMSVWLTPELEPFYGGTYFPPTAGVGRPAFLDVLREMARAWREERARHRRLGGGDRGRGWPCSSAGERRGAGRARAAAARRRRAGSSSRRFDERRGGFGDAPKFPRPVRVAVPAPRARPHRRGAAADMVLQTLRAMAMGGMRDHIGGGFHRYSVDGHWRVPHFEKMLYDQAQLVLACLEGGAGGGRSVLRPDRRGHAAVRGARHDRRPTAAFYSAEDADSVPPEPGGQAGAQKTEGAFYMWTPDEIVRVLGPERGLRAALRTPARRQRPIRSARRVRRQQHVLHGAVDRRHRAGDGMEPARWPQALARGGSGCSRRGRRGRGRSATTRC